MKSPIDTLLDNIEYHPVESPRPEENKQNLPYVTHEGILKIGEISFTVYVLSNGKRIIPSSELDKIFSALDFPPKVNQTKDKSKP